MNELEQITITYYALQKSLSQVIPQTLLELDEAIALGRGKTRFYLKDKRLLKFDPASEIHLSLSRNYYQDRDGL